MIRIAIVDDEREVRDNIENLLNEISITEDFNIEITQFESGNAFLFNYESNFEIVLLDIDMPGVDGLETAKKIRNLDSSVILIFVTYMTQYAIWGYEVEALDFIVKPINKYSFSNKIKRAFSRVPERMDDYITIKSDKEIMKIQISTIRYIEVDKHYVIYHTVTGNYSEYATLKDAIERINKDYFISANRSCLVNPNYITAVSKEYVAIGEEKIYISRPQKKAFMAAVAQYLGGGR